MLKECPGPYLTLLKIPTFSSSFFLSSLNWLILCLRNWLSCKTSFSVDASFCSSSSCWEWDADWSENGVWREVFSYCGYSERETHRQGFTSLLVLNQWKDIGNEGQNKEHTQAFNDRPQQIPALLLLSYVPWSIQITYHGQVTRSFSTRQKLNKK